MVKVVVMGYYCMCTYSVFPPVLKMQGGPV